MASIPGEAPHQSFSSSDDSDDEFLTNAGEGVDREALVRKKLLESFYGKSTVTDEAQDEDTKVGHTGARRSRGSRSKEETGNIHDLDSPAFDAEKHSVNHISASTTRELLETEERLALQVRNLDSTMQTLVYENYSRFIDATDAIRSIGVNVQANEAGLSSLTESMSRVSDRARQMDEALMGIRDQVAEKIRIQRLMARLDALLKLPATLQKQIAAGQYRNATSSYLSTASILAKHSEGFESLKSIETQCKSILKDLGEDLDEKILYWSGKSLELDRSESKVTALPKTMTDVFECVGAINILNQEKENEASHEELLSMSVASAMRLLDRMLDSHLIEVQERRYGSGMGGLMTGDSIMTAGAVLVPKNFLNSVLEGASYFVSTFGGPEEASSNGIYLTEFVSDAFSSFLSHVKVVLLEESSQRDETDDNGDDQREISTALGLLVHSVQDLELGLNNIGVSATFTSKLVNQVLDLTESMVRRRVDQKFRELQQKVAKECLFPFATKIGAQNADESLRLPETVQMATSMLSDCLQLLDDSIRSIFVESSADDMAKMKLAVESSTKKFVVWLANAIEILAGGEPAADVVVAPQGEDAEAESDDDEKDDSNLAWETEGALSGGSDSPLLDLLYNARDKISGTSNSIPVEFTLAMVELCRLAVSSVPLSISQSSSTHIGGSAKKKTRGIFPTDEPQAPGKDSSDNELGNQFSIASSFLLTTFVSREGELAADLICVGFSENAMKLDSEELVCPSECVTKALESGKEIALRCSVLFDCAKSGGPVPKWNEDLMPSNISMAHGRKTGLQLDVERMFKEHVTIYAHPNTTMAATVDAVMFLFFKIVLRSIWDFVGSHTFGPRGYQQCLLDAVFLKHMISHYVSDKFNDNNVNACSALSSLADDVVEELGDRCTDPNLRSDGRAKEEVASALRDLLSSTEKVGAMSFVLPLE